MSIECGWQRARRVGSKFVESMKEGEMIIKDPHVSRWHRRLRQEHSQTQSSFQLKVFWRNYRIVPPFPFPVVLLPRARNKKEHEMRSRSKGKNTDHLSISIINNMLPDRGRKPTFKNDQVKLARKFQHLHAPIESSCHPRWIASILHGRWSSYNHGAEGMKLTGTVYKTLGLGLPRGQFSSMERREAADIPWASVSTSTWRCAWENTWNWDGIKDSPIRSQCKILNIGMTPLEITSVRYRIM